MRYDTCNLHSYQKKQQMEQRHKEEMVKINEASLLKEEIARLQHQLSTQSVAHQSELAQLQQHIKQQHDKELKERAEHVKLMMQEQMSKQLADKDQYVHHYLLLTDSPGENNSPPAHGRKRVQTL